MWLALVLTDHGGKKIILISLREGKPSCIFLALRFRVKMRVLKVFGNSQNNVLMVIWRACC